MDIDKRKQDIAKRIWAEREDQNLTRAALAEIAGLAPTTINSIEHKAVITVPNLMLIADALYVPVSYLIGEENDAAMDHLENKITKLKYEQKQANAERTKLLEEITLLERENKRLGRILTQKEAVVSRVEELEKENKQLRKHAKKLAEIKTVIGSV